MARQLVVIIGAGASFDSVTHGGESSRSRKPPLVRELFHARYQDILKSYPLALDVAADVRPRLVEPAPDEKALMPFGCWSRVLH